MKFRRCSLCSVADPHHFDTDQEPDPDPACNFGADPDLACYFDADPDPSFQIKAQNLEKVIK
jgi:hypothetical protein